MSIRYEWLRGGARAHAFLYSSNLAMCGCQARRPPPDKERSWKEEDRCHNCVAAVDNILTGREPVTVLQRKLQDARRSVFEAEYRVLAAVRAGGAVEQGAVVALLKADEQLREAKSCAERNPSKVKRESRFERRERLWSEQHPPKPPKPPKPPPEPEPEPEPDSPCAPWVGSEVIAFPDEE